MTQQSETQEIKASTSVAGQSEISLLYGGSYNFKNQPERLKYVGKERGWHQFEKTGEMGVWCELLDSDLHMIEETANQIGFKHTTDKGKLSGCEHEDGSGWCDAGQGVVCEDANTCPDGSVGCNRAL